MFPKTLHNMSLLQAQAVEIILKAIETKQHPSFAGFGVPNRPEELAENMAKFIRAYVEKNLLPAGKSRPSV